jgi:hypothetical protein
MSFRPIRLLQNRANLYIAVHVHVVTGIVWPFQTVRGIICSINTIDIDEFGSHL